MPGSSAVRDREKFWNLLVNLIGKGDVVPIVGEDLLLIDGHADKRTVGEELAIRFAETNDIHVPESQATDLSAVVTQHRDFYRNPHDVYSGVGEEYAAWNPPIPDALRALARIRHFQLFVTTTFDDLLEQALNQERFGVSSSPKSFLIRRSAFCRKARSQTSSPVAGRSCSSSSATAASRCGTRSPRATKWSICTRCKPRSRIALSASCMTTLSSFWATAFPTGLPAFSCA